MFVATVLAGLVLAALLAHSAQMKLRRDARSVETIHGVTGVPLTWFAWLATAELLAAIGVLVGLVVGAIGVAAAIGAIAYFLGAVIAHLRVRDAGVVPALIAGALCAAYLGLRLASL